MPTITVAGGTGLIGAKLAALLTVRGHTVRAASRSTGVDTLTGSGLADALAGADVVVDTTRPPSSATDAEVFEFFTQSTANLLAAGRDAGIRHHITLTIVGTGEDTTVPYYRAKRAQEQLVRDGGVPFTLVHAPQFFEFFAGIAAVSTIDGEVRLPGITVQPIAGDDVALALADAAEGSPRGDVEIGGPECMRLDEFVRRGLAARGDERAVVRDDAATYFGGTVGEETLVPDAGARLFETRFDEWLAQ